MWLDEYCEWVWRGMLNVKDGEGEPNHPEDTQRGGGDVQNHHQH